MARDEKQQRLSLVAYTLEDAPLTVDEASLLQMFRVLTPKVQRIVLAFLMEHLRRVVAKRVEEQKATRPALHLIASEPNQSAMRFVGQLR